MFKQRECSHWLLKLLTVENKNVCKRQVKKLEKENVDEEESRIIKGLYKRG